MQRIPTYALYGESDIGEPGFWLHHETIHARSSQHDWEIQPHRHTAFFQILHVAAGNGDVIIGDETLVLGPNKVVTIPPGVSHGFRFSKDIIGSVITILSSHLDHGPGDRSELGQWLARSHRIDLARQTQDAEEVVRIFGRIGTEFERPNPGRNEILRSYIAILLHLLLRIAPGEEPLPDAATDARVKALISHINRHFRTQRSLPFYAALIGVSPTHLNRLVRSQLGCSGHELIERKILEEAKRQLLFSMNSIQEISYRLGFSDAAYFSRFFLRETGETPKRWRSVERARVEY
ncbi:helix-turn-helix domain-containing protein [Agrobacterium tumefaciens]|uniref:helix-turn-helix domain-containing protein n=1 Tax=Agrobacterium tumefaciens TaxID=358 RepID=UPI003BB8B8CB